MGFFSNLVDQFFGDPGFEETRDEFFDHAALSEVLPYRVYDDITGLYFNDKTIGFILEIEPQAGSGDIVGNIHSAMASSMPQNGGVQFINWSSPNIDATLGRWAASRVHGGAIVEEASAKRLEHIKSFRFGSESAAKAIPLNRRIFICGFIEGDTSRTAQSELLEFRRGLTSAVDLPKDASLPPVALLQLLTEVFHAQRWSNHQETLYSPSLPINAQLPGASLTVRQNHIQLSGDPDASLSASSVASYPREWDDSLGAFLFGEPDRITDRPHGPVLSMLGAIAIPAQKASADLVTKTGKLEYSVKNGFSKFTHDFEGKRAELTNLTNEVSNGERLFQTIYSVISYAGGGRDETRAASAEMSKIYRRVGINLRHERFLQLPMFLSSLPFGLTSKHMSSFGKMQRMRLLKGKALAALTPLHGEFKGNSAGQGMLLLGRQGQVMTWNNFVSEGNYNCSIVGKSGGGKSVFMQDLIMSIYSNGGRVLVIDDGYSFKTTCEILGGRHIAFDGSVDLRLNPFSMLQSSKMDTKEYAAEAIELIARVVSSMASLGEQREGRVTGIEEQVISDAIKEVWDTKGAKGEITDVYDILLERSAAEKRLADVCELLKRYTRDGVYGSYFVGEANVSVDQPLTVVELSDIKSQAGLEEVVLQLIMFLGSELMFKTDRSVPVAIVIDEAWDMLKGQGTAKFIEGVVRRARKYTGALITGTQSLSDYYSNPAAEVCLQNSDWMVMLQQKSETIDLLMQDGKLDVSPAMAMQLKSLRRVPGQFSEMAIKGEGGWFFGRLLLEPFSLAVYSSKGTTVQNLRRRQEAGMDTVTAINDMVAQGEVS